jgi:hypothetical protein
MTSAAGLTLFPHAEHMQCAGPIKAGHAGGELHGSYVLQLTVRISNSPHAIDCQNHRGGARSVECGTLGGAGCKAGVM